MTEQTAQGVNQPAYLAQEQINQALQSGVSPIPNVSFNQQEIPDICNNCRNIVLPNFKFCPHCGNAIGSNSGVSTGKIVYVYFMSAALPPSGLYWGIKYILMSNPKTKTVGIVAIIITIVSLIVTYIIGIGIYNQLKQYGLFQLLNNAGSPNQQIPSNLLQ